MHVTAPCACGPGCGHPRGPKPGSARGLRPHPAMPRSSLLLTLHLRPPRLPLAMSSRVSEVRHRDLRECSSRWQKCSVGTRLPWVDAPRTCRRWRPQKQNWTSKDNPIHTAHRPTDRPSDGTQTLPGWARYHRSTTPQLPTLGGQSRGWEDTADMAGGAADPLRCLGTAQGPAAAARTPPQPA